MRFTIRGLMAAVVGVAVLLALPQELRAVAAVMTLPVTAVFTARRLLARGRRRLAGALFWVPAALANALFAAFSVTPEGYLTGALILIYAPSL